MASLMTTTGVVFSAVKVRKVAAAQQRDAHGPKWPGVTSSKLTERTAIIGINLLRLSRNTVPAMPPRTRRSRTTEALTTPGTDFGALDHLAENCCP